MLGQIGLTPFIEVKCIFGHMAKNIASSNSRLYKEILSIIIHLSPKFHVNWPNNKGIRAIFRFRTSFGPPLP